MRPEDPPLPGPLPGNPLTDWWVGLQVEKGPDRGRLFEINHLPCRIGRKTGNEISWPADTALSGTHCRLFFQDGSFFIEDLGSTNGTYYQGRRIAGITPIVDGPVTVGQTTWRLVIRHRSMSEEDHGGRPETDPGTRMIGAGSLLIPPSAEVYRPREEVILVMDLSGSTPFIGRVGEKAFVRLIHALAQVVERQAQRYGALFFKCTGDGFLGTFAQANSALTAATHLLKNFLELTSRDPAWASLGLRLALHPGPVTVMADGDRLGRAVHQVCRLEGIKPEDQVEAPESPTDLPLTNRILASAEFLTAAGEAPGDSWADAGSFRLKGFTRPIRVYWLRNTESPIQSVQPGFLAGSSRNE